MKRITKYIILLLSGALMMGSCESNMNEIGASHYPSVNGKKLSPLSNESGSVRAYVGTEVSAEGLNLDLVGRVSVGDVDAQITERTMKTLKFKIPALELAQRDNPYNVELLVYGEDSESVIFRYPYYVTIPVTDALVTDYSPAEGTVGTEITVAGRNLMQITRVKFGTATIEAAAFASQADEAVKFAVPAGTYTPGDSQLAIAAEWGTQTIDVTGENLFTLHIPKVETPTQSAPSVIGDEIVLAGENLGLISSVKWGDSELTITEQNATAMTVKIPSSIEQETPAVQTKDITALYGTPAQVITVATGWSLDTTPSSSVIIPVVVSMTADDGYYLGKTVTITGEELTAVEGIELWYTDAKGDQKIPTTIITGATNAKLEFTVPDGVTFTTATEVDVKVIYNTTDNLSAGTAKIYPFYVYKGLRMGTGSNSKNSYPIYNQQNAFLLLDSGTVISTDDWYNNSVDPFAKNETPIVSAAGTVKAGTPASDYYSVTPYLFFTTNSGHKLSLNSPANSASGIKTHCYGTGKTPLPAVFGSPVFYLRVMVDAADVAFKASIIDGSVESVADYSRLCSAGAPALNTAEASNAWVKGSVIVMQYVNAAACTGKAGTPTDRTDIYKQGFMYIRDITNADLSTGLANADRAGYIEFDLYWSKEMTK
ncbi:IPT/TIG domain-containing protein [uncultured Alistipes sp.]|jgi:lipoprotein|uniref:IPT/TIG domain-containing protein n=1 Tax=uncultured Alistipes sp. TaxID=538949 RepID=UPI0025E5D405|nr:IPT/TIG domain-containing protein [uncultured Alistipes sp.]